MTLRTAGSAGQLIQFVGNRGRIDALAAVQMALDTPVTIPAGATYSFTEGGALYVGYNKEGALVVQGVHGVEAQAVDVEVAQPHQRVVDDEAPPGVIRAVRDRQRDSAADRALPRFTSRKGDERCTIEFRRIGV